ncbi:PrsW family glutamic-type intramembrane protease [Micropruina sp.]|uniref:PrsW family glutamic-type intramembrane protease n=1 Tax=Micropruina sp. TaxID=2737536 RepID=UPI0039E4D735
MQCTRCHTDVPEAAHYCQVCGLDAHADDGARKASFAAKPNESVVSLKLVSTIMPRGAAVRPMTYQFALGLALLVTVIVAATGALPIAVLIAAFAMPLVYIVYLYDVNMWEDEPVLVTGLAFLLTAVLGGAWTWLWLTLRGPLSPAASWGDTETLAPTFGGFLIAALLVPVVGEAIRQIGPVVLAARPEFDDLMDGLTFGVISGVAFATADTLVKHWPLITGGYAGVSDAPTWISLLVLEGFVKPLLMGTATGIACAEFSGLGEGYDGFSPRYFRGLAEAVGANVLFAGGLYLLGFLGNPVLALVLSILWGLAILAVLIVRIRTALHRGLMEAALESTARARSTGPNLEFCPSCEMPLLPSALFCSNCGVSVRAAGKAPHAHVESTEAQA